MFLFELGSLDFRGPAFLFESLALLLGELSLGLMLLLGARGTAPLPLPLPLTLRFALCPGKAHSSVPGRLRLGLGAVS